MQRKLTTGALAAAMFTPILASGQATSELDAMKAELAAMRAELAQVKGGSTPQATADLQAATNAALEDARSRINYQTEELSAGHDGKFFLASPDGAFRLNFGFQSQVRYIANFRDEETAGEDDTLTGFQLRRTKFKFSGNIGDPKISYGVTISGNRNSNNAVFEAIKLGYKFDNGIKIEGGRFKAPFSFDELTSSSRQQTVERSFVNEQFTVGFTEGVMATFNPVDEAKVRVMINDGQGAGEGGNGDFNETPVDFGITARVDYVIGEDTKGGFAKDYTSWSGDDRNINIGGAFHYQADDDAEGTFTDDLTQFTADVLYNEAGISAFGAVYFADTGDDDLFGLQLQGGYTIDDKIEPFVRYEYVDFDDTENSLLTVGVNYFFKKHKAKFTVDGIFSFDELTSVSDGFGLEENAAGDDEQFALRAQFQLLF
ncbi:MAG: porin [Planctomycetota bacterium]